MVNGRRDLQENANRNGVKVRAKDYDEGIGAEPRSNQVQGEVKEAARMGYPVHRLLIIQTLLFIRASEVQNHLIRRKEVPEACMRSEAIFRAKEILTNRYQLCQTVAKTTRLMHVASQNPQDTINSALEKIASDSSVTAIKPA